MDADGAAAASTSITATISFAPEAAWVVSVALVVLEESVESAGWVESVESEERAESVESAEWGAQVA